MDPNEILFMTPTLNDAIPSAATSTPVTDDCVQLHEDDWRQFEFIPRDRKSDVEDELVDISAIWDNHSVSLGESGTAFNDVHVRKRIPNALAIRLSLSELESFVGQESKQMTFFGYGEVLDGVHAFTIDNLVVYAQIHDNNVTTFGFDAVDQFSLPRDFAKRLSDFVREHELMLVHWRSRTLFESHDDVMEFFGVSG